MDTKKEKNKQEDKLIKYVDEDTNQIKKLIIILVCVFLITGLLYVASSKFIIKDGVSDEETTEEESIDYTSINVGNIFNRPYDEYYVFAYDPDSLEASLYASYLTMADVEKIYFLDLSNEINKRYIGTGNELATTPSEISLEEPTLIKIKNGKIVKYLVTIEDIAKEL